MYNLSVLSSSELQTDVDVSEVDSVTAVFWLKHFSLGRVIQKIKPLVTGFIY